LKRLWIVLFVVLAAAAAAEDGYVFGEGKALTTVGQDIDIALLSKLPERYGEHFLWMRRGGKTYVVRDGKTLERGEELMKPQRDLEAKRADVAHRQVALSREFTKYGREQALLGAELAKISVARDDAKTAELQARMAEVAAKTRAVRVQQADLDKELRAIVEEQKKLQPELMKALGAFADEAIAKGVANAE